MTNVEFRAEVMAYQGKYSAAGLQKFYRYYTEKKHFSTIPKFTLTKRLATWFSPKRQQGFKAKMEKKKVGKTKEQQAVDFYKNFLDKVNPLA